MDDFLGNDNVGRNMPILDESSLGMINVVGKVRLQSISQRFSYNLINNITKTNRSEVLRQNRLHFLRDEDNKSLIQLWLKKC